MHKIKELPTISLSKVDILVYFPMIGFFRVVTKLLRAEMTSAFPQNGDS